MKLQINQRGAWRNGLDYPAERHGEVRYAAARLARAADVKLRILDDKDQVTAWFSPNEGWTTPTRGQS